MIDTTDLSPRELRRHLEETLLADSLSDQLFVSLQSFGYRYGLPDEADMVLDARFLPNPHWVPRTAAAVRAGPGGEGLRAGTRRSREFLDQVVDSGALPRAAVLGRAEAEAGAGAGLHRGAASVGGADRGAGQAA